MKGIEKGAGRLMARLGRNKSGRLRKCKPFILAGCVLFSLLMLFGSTLAWFTAADTVANNMKTPQEKGFMLDLVDVFDETPDGNDVYSKRVGAANTEEKDAFVRLLVIPTIVIDPAAPGGNALVLPAVLGTDVILQDLNTTDWIDCTDITDGGDGYFYYKYILEGKTSTDTSEPAIAGMTYLDKNLFGQVVISPELLEEYPTAHLRIEVKLEAVDIKPASEYRLSWWNWDGTGANPLPAALLNVDSALQSALS